MKKQLIVVTLWLALLAAPLFARININTASVEQLQTLKGVGPARARAIIDYREQHGPFQSVDELDKVKGFGPKSLQKLEGQISVTGPSEP